MRLPTNRDSRTWAVVLLAGIGGCSDPDTTKGPSDESTVTLGMKNYLAGHIDTWLLAAQELQASAPLPTGRGWDKTLDADAIVAMKKAWMKARWAYEHIEGAVAPVFPDSDLATDARYDDYLVKLNVTGDKAPFDDKGVVGMHGIERILYANNIPPYVDTHEMGLLGYNAAAFPGNEAEAVDFKTKLAAKLVGDIKEMKRLFTPLTLDLGFVFHGVIDLVNEQVEKISKAASGQEESRYSQLTMRDLRANFEGCREVYNLFRPWLVKKTNGGAVDVSINTAFDRLKTVYDVVTGDGIPQPPATWSSSDPRPEDLQSPFGKLFVAVDHESDQKIPGSLHSGLAAAAAALRLEAKP